MTKRDIVELGLKAFGIYFVVYVVRAVPMMIILFSSDLPEFVANGPAYRLLNSMQMLLPLLFAWLFLFHSAVIASWIVRDDRVVLHSGDAQPAHASLSFWIIIIGLYYSVSSAGDLLNHLVKLCFEVKHYAPSYTIQFSTRDLIPSALGFALSLIFIFKSRAIEQFIVRKTKGGT